LGLKKWCGVVVPAKDEKVSWVATPPTRGLKWARPNPSQPPETP